MMHHYPPPQANVNHQPRGYQQYQLPSSVVPSQIDYSKMNYAELVKYAEAQRMTIDQNNTLIQQKEARLKLLHHNQRTPQAHAAVQARLASIRHEVGREEAEVSRLRQVQVREYNITR